MDYKQKYLKYKTKYLDLKGSGDIADIVKNDIPENDTSAVNRVIQNSFLMDIVFETAGLSDIINHIRASEINNSLFNDLKWVNIERQISRHIYPELVKRIRENPLNNDRCGKQIEINIIPCNFVYIVIRIIELYERYCNNDFRLPSIENDIFNYILFSSIPYDSVDDQNFLIRYGATVTTIDSNAFSNRNLVTITIPNSVTLIGNHAFYNNKLITVNIPNSVTSIGNHAFSINRLITVNISNNVRLVNINAAVFYLNNLTTVNIPNNIKVISRIAFASNYITSVIMTNSVTDIDVSSFIDNYIKTATIPIKFMEQEENKKNVKKIFPKKVHISYI